MKIDSDGVKLWEQVVGNPQGLIRSGFTMKHGESKRPATAVALSRPGRAMNVPTPHRLTVSVQINGRPIS